MHAEAIARRLLRKTRFGRLLRRALDRLAATERVRRYTVGRATVRRLEATVDRHRPQRIAIITGEPAAVAPELARRYHREQVHVLDIGGAEHPPNLPPTVTVHHASTVTAIHETLSRLAPMQLLIESSRRRARFRISCLRNLLYHLEDGGVYIVDTEPTTRSRRSAGAEVWDAVCRVLADKADSQGMERAGRNPDERAHAEVVDAVLHDGRIIAVRKAGTHALRVHDDRAEEVLAGRHGSGWGRRIDVRCPVSYPARGRAWSNMLEHTFAAELAAPQLYLREYRDVVCAPRQLAVQGDVVLPISYHHALRPRLWTRSPLLHECGPHFAVLDESIRQAPRLPGEYYHLDSEFPGHFGHFMTEDVAKLWGWAAARAAHPQLKVLVSTLQPGGEPSPVQREVMEAWGIATSDVVCIDAPVRVDVLVGATQMFYNARYAHPELLDIWSRLREALRSPPATRAPSPPRLFVTRGPRSLRPCRNRAEVEQLFAAHGFDIVQPELLPIREQVDLFADAQVIAGFAGSGLFSAMYSTRPGRRIVISSDEYLARNEWVIAAALGDDYHHFFAPAEIRRADVTEKWRAFQSGFTFDFDRDGAALESLLRG